LFSKGIGILLDLPRHVLAEEVLCLAADLKFTHQEVGLICYAAGPPETPLLALLVERIDLWLFRFPIWEKTLFIQADKRSVFT